MPQENDGRLLRMHPWVWLNEPQHGTAVAAVASVVYTVAAIVAGIYAAGAYRAAKAQAASASEQTRIVREQALLAAEFHREQREADLREERRQRAVDEAAFQKAVAEEENIRPRWDVSPTIWHENRYPAQLRLTNVGNGAAFGLEVRLVGTKEPQAAVAVMKAMDSVEFYCPIALSTTYIEVSFHTVAGSWWTVLLYGKGGIWKEQSAKAIRPYSALHDGLASNHHELGGPLTSEPA